jgi:hypothetical protein
MSAMPAIDNRKSPMGGRAGGAKLRSRGKLFGLFKRICIRRGLAGTREDRLAYSSGVLGRPIETWKGLFSSDVGELVHEMQRELGDVGASGAGPGEAERGSALRLRYLLWLVPQVYGADWDALLHARLERQPYYFFDSVERLDPRRMRGLIEEMLDVLARKRIQDSGFRIQDVGAVREPPLPGAELRAAKEALRREMIAAVRGRQSRSRGVGESNAAKESEKPKDATIQTFSAAVLAHSQPG